MSIIIEYFKYQEEYQEKYGERTVVFYQVGSFMEIYEIDPESDMTGEVYAWPTKRLGHAVYLSSLLGYKLTRRNKNKPYGLNNPNMIGIPCIAYEKHRDLILSKEYTIIVVTQDHTGKNRSVTDIVSPATMISDLSSTPITNQIVSIYIEIQKVAPNIENFLITVGISTIDVTTGNNVVSEVYSKEKDAIYAMQEVYRFLLSIQPREIIINIIGIVDSEKYKNYIIKTLELDKYSIYVIVFDKVNKEYLKSNYHQKFLSKIFIPSNPSSQNNNNNNTGGVVIINDLIIEELGLERMHYGTISYVLLLQYCYEHNERLIEKIQKPDTHWIDSSKHLMIAHNAIKQLNILSSNKVKRVIDSLISVLDNTSTSLGKRFLQTMITNPLTDPIVINDYYDMVHDIMEIKDNEIGDILKKIPDIERYQRKLQLKIIKPNEFVTLFRAYINIVKLYIIIMNSNTKLTSLLFPQVQEFNHILSEVLSRYVLDNLYAAVLDKETLISEEPILYPGDKISDNYLTNINTYKSQLGLIVDYLNTKLNGTRGKLISLELIPNGGHIGFTTTPHKGKVLSQSGINSNICGNIIITNVNKDVLITSDKISILFNNLYNNMKEYNEYLYRCYNQTVSNLSICNFFSDINIFISKLDYIHSNSITATKYKYFRPEISTTPGLIMAGLRHPIAERLIDSEYITNDLSLGSLLTEGPYGILLYGANSTGKSTLAKSVGLCIIMAQAGMFVPAKLKYSPYNKIITRLSGEDDLIGGKSSFICEMTELRTILRNADEKTLVLGDELCRGTESISGTSLTIATIDELIKRKVSFIFSTHMHHLVDNSYIINLPAGSLRICHLVLRYDQETKSLIYDRKLKEGSGESIYGLEVAMSLAIDNNFIRKAFEIRKSLMGDNTELLTTKKSRYNDKIYMDSCTMCGNNINIITHHINEQHKADVNGFIDHYHKNSSFNLITLCEECHINLHKNGLKIITEQTPSGKLIKIF